MLILLSSSIAKPRKLTVCKYIVSHFFKTLLELTGSPLSNVTNKYELSTVSDVLSASVVRSSVSADIAASASVALSSTYVTFSSAAISSFSSSSALVTASVVFSSASLTAFVFSSSSSSTSSSYCLKLSISEPEKHPVNKEISDIITSIVLNFFLLPPTENRLK